MVKTERDKETIVSPSQISEDRSQKEAIRRSEITKTKEVKDQTKANSSSSKPKPLPIKPSIISEEENR